jgi:hypothetical protein
MQKDNDTDNSTDVETQEMTTGNSSISSIKYCSMCSGLAAFNSTMLALGQLPKCYGNEVVITPTEHLEKKLNDVISGGKSATTDFFVFEEPDNKSSVKELDKTSTTTNKSIDKNQDLMETISSNEPTMNQSNFIMGKVVIVQYDHRILMIPTLGICYSTQSTANKSTKLNTTTSSTTMLSSSERVQSTTTTTTTASTTATTSSTTTTTDRESVDKEETKPKKSILEQINNVSEWRYVILKTDNIDTNRKYMFTDEVIEANDGESIVSETYVVDIPNSIAGYYSNEAVLAYNFWSKTLDDFPSRWLNFTMKYGEVTYDYTNKFVGYFVDFYKKQWSSFNYDIAMEKLNYVYDTYSTESNKLFSRSFGEFETDVQENIPTPPVTPTIATTTTTTTTNTNEKENSDNDKK